MGKRNRTGLAAPDNSPSDSMPCPSGRDLTPAENSCDPEDSSIFEPLSSVKDIMDIRGKQPNSQFSLGQHHYNLSRAMFLKRSRHHYGNQYFRRNSPNCPRFPAFGKSSPSNDERLCFKYGSRYGSESGNHPDFAEFREKGLWWPERIRTSSSVIEAVPPVGLKTICGICERAVKWKPHHFGSTISSEELSIVAILVCGHIYHANCLEQRTRPEDIRDPPCPVCLESFLPRAEAAWTQRRSRGHCCTLMELLISKETVMFSVLSRQSITVVK